MTRILHFLLKVFPTIATTTIGAITVYLVCVDEIVHKCIVKVQKRRLVGNFRLIQKNFQLVFNKLNSSM